MLHSLISLRLLTAFSPSCALRWIPLPSRDKVGDTVIEPFGELTRGRGKRYALPLASASVFLAIANGGISVILKLFLQEQGATTLVIGAIASVNAAGALLGSLMWGRVSDRSALRPLLFATVLGAATAISVLIALPPAALALGSTFVRAFMRLGFATVTMAIVSGASATARRGKNLSYVTSAQSMGFAIGSIFAGFLLEQLGYRWGFAVMAGLPLIGIAFLFTLPHEPAPITPARRSSWKLALSSGLADLFISTILRQIAIFGTFSMLVVYMAANGIPPRYIGVVSAFNTGTQVLALILFGRLADRVGRRRIFMLGFGMSALTPCVFAISTHIAVMMVGYAAVGISFSSLHIGTTAHIGDRIPADRLGTMLGLYETCRGLGGVLGPLIAGTIAPLVGFPGMFVTMGGIAALGFLLMLTRRLVSRS